MGTGGSDLLWDRIEFVGWAIVIFIALGIIGCALEKAKELDERQKANQRHHKRR